MSRRRRPTWITKTDLITFVRCPYAFSLLDRGLITRDDMVDEFQVRLLNEGLRFQRAVEAKAVRIDAAPEEIPSLLRQEIALLDPPAFENKRLKIHGRPDGIEAARGALIPIEIKSHKDVQPTDELELAFYWLLLDPYRTRQVIQPRGVLLLKREGEPERVEVPIREHRFEQVRRLLEEIRDARSRGVRPRICGCNVCSRVRRDEVHRAARKNRDLTLIWDIARERACHLERIGLRSWEHLLACDPDDVVARLRDRKQFVSSAQVERWQHHARAWKTQAPVFFGDERSVDGHFIALDLEYLQGPDGLVWLIGGCVVDGEARGRFAFWSDSAREEKLALQRLDAILRKHPYAPVVTWNGNGADLPNLRHAAKRTRVTAALAAVTERHLDVFQYATRNFRLPIPRLGLKEVAEYFGIPRLSAIRNGLEAEWRYYEYLSTRDRARRGALRGELLDYNSDDVGALVASVEKIRELSAAHVQPSQPGMMSHGELTRLLRENGFTLTPVLVAGKRPDERLR